MRRRKAQRSGSAAKALWVVPLLLLVAFFGLMKLDSVLSDPQAELVVRVSSVGGAGVRDDGAPPVYRYGVVLADGKKASVSSSTLFQVGSRLRVTQFRTAILGRTLLGNARLLVEESEFDP